MLDNIDKLNQPYKDVVIKTFNTIEESNSINTLEEEWSKYKYLILEHSHRDYLNIRTLLKDKNSYPKEEFINIIVSSLLKEKSQSSVINGFDHVWGYFKKKANKEEKEIYKGYKNAFINGIISIAEIKKFLYNLALKYEESYLLKSYYFIDL